MTVAASDRPFLDVSRSVTGRAWRDRLERGGANTALAIAERYGIPELVARVLAARGVGLAEAEGYLDPTLKGLLPDPARLTDMEAATARIADAVERSEPVAIFGDYDVDGATSAALLGRFLRTLGREPRIYIPDRIFEGYGPSPAAIDALADEGARLIVTVDCGVSSFEALERARVRGLDVVVLDHHQVGEELPPAVAVVNPNRVDDLSGEGHLAAVGVSFLAAVAINRELRRRGFFAAGRTEPDLLGLLDLVALGTVADVVPLKGVNRAFVVKGLVPLRHRANPGLAALQDVARLSGPAAPYHLGFLLGPRINAGGRVGDAALGARLLMCDDPDEAAAIALRLDQLNAERQAIEAETLAAADAEAAAEVGEGAGPAVLVTIGADWHPGVVGLVASRLKDRWRRPAFAVALAGDIGTGSGRSIPGVDLGLAVRAAVGEGILDKGGGHAMAAGITLRRGAVGEFRAFLEERLAADVDAARSRDALKIDGAMTAAAASLQLMETIERAGPYGAGHPEPIFAFPAHRVAFADRVGQNHLRLSLAASGGSSLKAIAFRAAGEPLGNALEAARNGQPLHIAGTLSVDHWGGSPRLQLRVVDAAEIRAR